MQIHPMPVCCGLGEAYLTRTYDEAGKDDSPEKFINRIGKLKKAFIILSQAATGPVDDGYGFTFVARVQANALGDIIETDWHINPNSGNFIKVWVWTINHEACLAYKEKKDGGSNQ